MFRVEEQVIEVPVEYCSFWEAPVCDTARLEQSLRKKGIITPVIARGRSESYQVCLGQKRLLAAIRIGMNSIPVLVRDLQDNEVRILRIEDTVVHENIKEWRPSKLADAIGQYYSSMKAQGRRTDLLQEVRTFLGMDEQLTFRPLGEKLDSGKATGQLFGIGSRSVERYVRIAGLCEELKVALDCKFLGLRTAVELSYLEPYVQEAIGEKILKEKIKVSISAGCIIRQLSSGSVIDLGLVTEALTVKNIRKRTLKDVMEKYGFTGLTEAEYLDIVDKAVSQYVAPY